MPLDMDGLSEEMSHQGILDFMKLVTITIFVIITLAIKGVMAAIVMAALLIPFFFLSKILQGDNSSLKFWSSSFEKENFSNMPLRQDTHLVRKAKKGSKVKQALIEERLRDEILYTLKNENELTDEQTEKLRTDRGDLNELIDNEKFLRYLRDMKCVDDIKSDHAGKENDLFCDDGQKTEKRRDIDFEQKVKEAIEELEKVNGLDGYDRG